MRISTERGDDGYTENLPPDLCVLIDEQPLISVAGVAGEYLFTADTTKGFVSVIRYEDGARHSRTFDQRRVRFGIRREQWVKPFTGAGETRVVFDTWTPPAT